MGSVRISKGNGKLNANAKRTTERKIIAGMVRASSRNPVRSERKKGTRSFKYLRETGFTARIRSRIGRNHRYME